MSKAIYLCKEHENFQVGIGHLESKSHFRSGIITMMFGAMMALLMLYLGATPVYKFWLYSQTGAETRGELLSCDFVETTSGSRHSSKTYVTYSYVVNGINYQDRDLAQSWSPCTSFIPNSQAMVYYLSDNPQESAIESFVDWDEWIYAGYLIPGIFIFILSITFLIQDIKIYRRQTRLEKSGILLDAKVLETEALSLKHDLAMIIYRFTSPDGIETENISFGALDVEAGDTLHILYADDTTYCVL